MPTRPPAAVSIGPREGSGFGIAVKLRIEENICPFSHATGGNVDVSFEVIGA